MQYVHLLGACNGEKSLDAFVRLFSTVVGISLIEERESSNYVDGRYFRGKICRYFLFGVVLGFSRKRRFVFLGTD